MNTSTRAAFKDANACHASTAQGPLLTPNGLIMPTRTTTTTSQPGALCLAIADAYAEAIADPDARLPITPRLRSSARNWLLEQYSHITPRLGYWPDFVNRACPLDESLAAFSNAPAHGELCRWVPITSQNNNPHPVWTHIDNLTFRFVHDWHHYQTGAPATFAGELAVTLSCLTPEVKADRPLAQFLASEIIGQAASAIVTGTYPPQIIAAGILDLIT
jgi:hypothetical protein